MKPALTTEDAPLDLSGNGIWQRLPNESPGSYAAFADYLELGAQSTLEELADKIGRSPQSVRHLSWRHNWMDRAAAYRQHVSQTHLASVQRERARQTELSQMRDQIFRQELWEQRQTIRAVIRKGFNALLDDSNSKIAAYELARLMDIDFKSGARATAPTGFSSDGPVPASPDFDAAVEQVYGKGLNLEDLLDLIKRANPGQEALIDQKLNPAAIPATSTDPHLHPNGNGNGHHGPSNQVMANPTPKPA